MWIITVSSVAVLFLCLGTSAQSFEVATIKPTPAETRDEWFTIRGRHVVTVGTSLTELVKFGYGLHPTQIAGAQPWMWNERFNIDAVAGDDRTLTNEDMRRVIREILTSRFGLVQHTQPELLPVFTLTLLSGDSKLTKSSRPPGQPADIYGSNGELTVRNASMAEVAVGLSRGMLSRPVVDQTGLSGRYDFTLHWSSLSADAGATNTPTDLVSALPEEAGLRIKAAKAEIPVMHVDAATHPSQD